jgi:hypothetical protein
MDCTRRKDTWSPPEVFIYKPFLKKGHFFNFSSGILISNPEATEIVGGHLEAAGELLPLPYREEIYTLLNVTECIDCLHQESTKWHIGRTTGKRIGIDKYAFYSDRFSESDLFKIPETFRGEILYVEGKKAFEDSFRYVVESNDLQGLLFTELWSDE